MNDKLCDAVRKAIDTHGLDVLKSPKFTNVLLDYGAFDVHDREMPIRKEIIASLILSGYGEKLIRWKKKSRDWKSKHDDFINTFKRKNNFDNNTVDEITDAFVNGIGLIAIATPSKKRKNLKETIFGKRINVDEKDKTIFIAGGVLVLSELLFSLLVGQDEEGLGLIFGLVFLFVYIFIVMAIYKGTDTINKAGANYAFLLGGFITLIIPFLIVAGSIPIWPIIALLSVFTFLSYFIGRFETTQKPQRRLFGYTLASIFLLLIIVYSVPLMVRQTIIKEHKKECIESLNLRKEHIKQGVTLGFMGIHLGDYYHDVVKQLKQDTNIVCKIQLDKEPYSHLDDVVFDDYEDNCFIQHKYIQLEFDKELQYDVSFDNKISRLYLLFYQDTVRYIQFNGGNEELYVQKYGLPEYYYTEPPEKYVTSIDTYPFFKKGYYKNRYLGYDERSARIAQWTFANGVIRANSYSAEYISNVVFDTIAARNERANREAEQLRLKQEEEAQQMELEKAKQEKEEAEKKAQELKQREEERKRAIEQI